MVDGGPVGPERAAAHAVLDCWFGAPGSPTFGRARKLWFSRDKVFDAMLLERFGTLIDAAREGSLDGWTDTPLSALALVIVLDQFLAVAIAVHRALSLPIIKRCASRNR